MSEEGSEDSPPRSKRKIKKVMVLPSSSSSDSDDSVTVAGTRRKRLRVLSDEGASDSSGSSVVRAGTRRARTVPKLRDSDVDSDTSDWATDHSDEPKPTPTTSKPISGFASDSSEGNSDKCSICLLRFTTQEVGTPQSCEHIFCLDCITEWSKNVNTCPVDRMTFDYLVVRESAGGRVLRTDPVRVVERRPSVDMLVVEDPTVCEICGSTENEEEMLLCDGCDLGYHMQCLTPPLREVPMDQWLCPNCDDLLSVIHLSEVDNLFSDIVDMDLPLRPRSSSLREVRNVRRSSRAHRAIDEPSTSSGHRGNVNTDNVPTTSRGAGTSRTSNPPSTRQRTRTTHRTHRRKYRRTKTVIIEYEVQENGKVPVTKTIRRRIKKRKTKRRQPRTAARRSYVLESVRAKLASQRAGSGGASIQRHDSAPAHDLALRRQRAGIPSLSLFGDPYQLDYFSDNENDAFEGPSTAAAAVAIRPTSSILSAYRQARRKMISIPSPPASASSSTSDVLSSILESQALLHSKKSVVSISVDGNVNIKLESRQPRRQPKTPAAELSTSDKVDVSKGEDAARKVPSYPGQSRGGAGGGGWGGGYRGSYHRDQGTNNFNNRGGNYDSSYGGGYQNRQGNSFHQNNMRREDADAFDNYARRPHQYSHNDDLQFERNRRQSTDNNRGPHGNFPHNQRMNDQSRYPYWQPHAGSAAGPRQDGPPAQHRHSFGGFDNPLDMRMGQTPLGSSTSSLGNPVDVFPSSEPLRQEKPPTQPFQPLPEPPIFKFDKTPELEKSEDEKSDSSLVIDTEKYDPMEPTNDDDSSEEDKVVSLTAPGPDLGLPQPEREAVAWQAPALAPAADMAPPSAVPRSPTPPPSHSAVQNILAGIDTSSINVPHNILDNAVRQVLMEHRNLITPSSIQSHNDKSDDDSDGDCPNFSIYSATSVHIANNTGMIEAEVPKELPQDNLEDLVQEDDDSPETTPSTAIQTDSLETLQSSVKVATPNKYSIFDSNMKKKTDEEYKEKVSKRCPITTNTRNPIKIKLNTPSLIKRQITLYDEEEDINDDVEPPTKVDDNAETQEEKIEHIKETFVNPSTSPTIDKNVSPDKENVEEHSNERKNSLSEENDKLPEDTDEGCETPETPDVEDDDVPPSEEKDEAFNSIDDNNKKLEEEPDNNVLNNGSDKASELEFNEDLSDVDNEDLCTNTTSPKTKICTTDRSDENLEKMTESISETEDERSYTPCLDENKSKDTSLEADKDKGIEGLDTEMISEDEGNEMFSDTEKVPDTRASPPSVAPLGQGKDHEEGEILDKKKEGNTDDTRKKKKKDSKKDSKDKKVKMKKSDVAFKKLSKSGKERNYREREKDERSKSKKDRRDSGESTERERLKQKRKEKRKDLERYDVRNVVTVKRKKLKDPFGRDISPRARSRSASAVRSPLHSRSPSPSPLTLRRRSPSPTRRRSLSSGRGRSPSPVRRRSPSPVRRRSPSPVRRRSPSPGRRRSVTPVRRRSPSPGRRRSPDLRRRSGSPTPGPGRARATSSPRAGTPRAPSPAPRRRRRRSVERAEPRRRRSPERARKRRRSADLARSPKPKTTKRRKRARSERAGSRRRSPRRKTPKRKKPRRRSASREPEPEPGPPAAAWSPASAAERLPSPRTPPPDSSPQRVHPAPDPVAPAPAPAERRARRRRDPERVRHRRARDQLGPLGSLGPSKEVFTSGDNILVSVSFKEQERQEAGERRERRERRRSRRRRRRAADRAPDAAAPKPVAIIDLERSPFRELTPSPKNVIVLSDSEPGEKEPPAAGPAPGPAAVCSAPDPSVGPRTPPEPGGSSEAGGAGGETAAAAPAGEERGPNTPPEPPSSPDAYDPFEPTRSASASPAPVGSPPLTMMTLETAQKTNMSADEVLDRRPLSPIEKVMALLQSTRDVSPEPPPGDAALQGGMCEGPSLAPPAPPAALIVPPAPAPAASPALAAAPAPAPAAPPVRIVLPSPTRAAAPKLFLAKPSPIKSDPIKPMQAAKLPRAMAAPCAPRRRDSSSDPGAGMDSPYSPGSSDFGDLFEPPAPLSAASAKRDVFDVLLDRPFRRKPKSSAAKVPVKLNRRKGRAQVGVKVDEDNLKVLDDLPSSAVEMQVKSKFIKKLNRQERVVEEVKLVLKPHYNKKHVTKDEYKHILRRTVPKICHNKTGEINPTKIQALVEAYVKKFRKKHKLGLV